MPLPRPTMPWSFPGWAWGRSSHAPLASATRCSAPQPTPWPNSLTGRGAGRRDPSSRRKLASGLSGRGCPGGRGGCRRGPGPHPSQRGQWTSQGGDVAAALLPGRSGLIGRAAHTYIYMCSRRPRAGSGSVCAAGGSIPFTSDATRSACAAPPAAPTPAPVLN